MVGYLRYALTNMQAYYSTILITGAKYCDTPGGVNFFFANCTEEKIV